MGNLLHYTLRLDCMRQLVFGILISLSALTAFANGEAKLAREFVETAAGKRVIETLENTRFGKNLARELGILTEATAAADLTLARALERAAGLSDDVLRAKVPAFADLEKNYLATLSQMERLSDGATTAAALREAKQLAPEADAFLSQWTRQLYDDALFRRESLARARQALTAPATVADDVGTVSAGALSFDISFRRPGYGRKIIAPSEIRPQLEAYVTAEELDETLALFAKEFGISEAQALRRLDDARVPTELLLASFEGKLPAGSDWKAVEKYLTPEMREAFQLQWKGAFGGQPIRDRLRWAVRDRKLVNPEFFRLLVTMVITEMICTTVGEYEQRGDAVLGSEMRYWIRDITTFTVTEFLLVAAMSGRGSKAMKHAVETFSARKDLLVQKMTPSAFRRYLWNPVTAYSKDYVKTFIPMGAPGGAATFTGFTLFDVLSYAFFEGDAERAKNGDLLERTKQNAFSAVMAGLFFAHHSNARYQLIKRFNTNIIAKAKTLQTGLSGALGRSSQKMALGLMLLQGGVSYANNMFGAFHYVAVMEKFTNVAVEDLFMHLGVQTDLIPADRLLTLAYELRDRDLEDDHSLYQKAKLVVQPMYSEDRLIEMIAEKTKTVPQEALLELIETTQARERRGEFVFPSLTSSDLLKIYQSRAR